MRQFRLTRAIPSIQHYLTLFALLLSLLCFTHKTHSQTFVRTEQTTVSILSDSSSLAPGDSFHLGFRFDMIPEWHIYWENPGDSGLPPSLEVNTHQGVTVSDFFWPAPETIPVGPLVNFGYSNSVLLPFLVSIPSTITGDTFEAALRLDWLICKEDCLPQSGEFVISIPLSKQTTPSRYKTYFEQTLSQIPSKVKETGTMRISSSGITGFFPLDQSDEIESVYFFPRDGSLIEPAAIQQFSASEEGLRIAFKISSSFTELSAENSGFLRIARQNGTNEVLDFSLLRVGPEQTSSRSIKVEGAEEEVPLLLTLIFAFLGGMILNLMPCVFPVISIKLLSFLNKSQSGSGTVRQHALSFASGIVLSMLLLGVLILLIKGAGTEVGWGFQLQSPIFVALLALLFFALSLSFLGYYEFGSSLARLAGSAETKNTLKGSFWSGVLTTAIATPCTGPFLGVALGFALSQTALLSMAVFLTIGLGIAFPYILLAFYPSLIKVLPKPGEWMETLKQLLAFPLLLTTFYLLWVLARQSASAGILLTLGSMLMLFSGIWVYKRFVANFDKSIFRVLAKMISLALLLAAVANIFLIEKQVESSSSSDSTIVWEKFRPGLAEELAEKGNIVYVDFTAAWCITCQVNKRVVFRSERVLSFIKEHQVKLVQADWTNRDAMITEALESFGRAGVPFNLIYSPHTPEEPLELPALLTPSTVLSALDQASKSGFSKKK